MKIKKLRRRWKFSISLSKGLEVFFHKKIVNILLVMSPYLVRRVKGHETNNAYNSIN
jgi:hypothetical protein